MPVNHQQDCLIAAGLRLVMESNVGIKQKYHDAQTGPDCCFCFLFLLGRSDNERHGGDAFLRRS